MTLFALWLVNCLKGVRHSDVPPCCLLTKAELDKSKHMTIKNFARSLVILMAALLAPLGIAHADPNQGPGGPILVITDGNQNFGKFYAEILRTEGFNEFAVAELGSVSASTLNTTAAMFRSR